MDPIANNPDVKHARERLDALQAQRTALLERIDHLEREQAAQRSVEADPVAVALGEIQPTPPASEELHTLRGTLANIVSAIGIQQGRVLAAESEVSATANRAAMPGHVKACMGVRKALASLADALEKERAVRDGLAAAGFSCTLEPVCEGVRVPDGAVADLDHYIAINTADEHGEPVRGIALVDIPGLAKVGQAIEVNPREAARMIRDGSFDPKAPERPLPARGAAAPAGLVLS